jgi:hypothetical protein
MTFRPKTDGTYVIEFRTAAGGARCSALSSIGVLAQRQEITIKDILIGH